MREAGHAKTYEQRVQAIQLANQPILDGFETWLRQSRLSEQTIKDHVDNMRFFARYLLLYAYSLRRLDEATGCCHRTWWINRSPSAKTLRAGFFAMRQSGHATSPWSEAHPPSSPDPFTHPSNTTLLFS